jgi:hypothetical protein
VQGRREGAQGRSFVPVRSDKMQFHEAVCHFIARG